jgi:hypothetical protein
VVQPTDLAATIRGVSSEVAIVIRTVTKVLFVATTVAVPTFACSKAASDAPTAAAESAAAQSAAPAASGARAISACRLLTTEEIQAAAGWPVKESVPTENPGPPALSICNFLGTDLTRSVTVWYGEGSGARFKTSAEMAAALGTRDGMLTEPAQALEGLGIPATREKQLGGLIHVHGINSAGDELTVAAGSFDVARALFVEALARLEKL